MDISGIFDDISAQMRRDFEKARKALDHRGLKGAAFEDAVRDFLKSYLPSSLAVCTGQLIDSTGAQSNQCTLRTVSDEDVMIATLQHGLDYAEYGEIGVKHQYRLGLG